MALRLFTRLRPSSVGGLRLNLLQRQESRNRIGTDPNYGETNMRKLITLLTLIVPCSTGCVVVGGYSSGRGWFIWPGTIVIFVVVLLLVLLLRRRR